MCEGLHHHQTFWVFSFDGERLVLLLDLHNHGLLQYIKKTTFFHFLGNVNSGKKPSTVNCLLYSDILCLDIY